jgi:hypothetical protein
MPTMKAWTLNTSVHAFIVYLIVTSLCCLQDAQEGDEVCLFLRGEVQFQYEVEELCGVFEC